MRLGARLEQCRPLGRVGIAELVERPAQYGRALDHLGEADAAERAALLEARAEAHYAADEQLASIDDLEAAIELHRAAGDAGREADATAALTPRLLCRARNDEARAAVARAIELVGGAPRRETARALAALAHVEVVVDHLAASIAAAERGDRRSCAVRRPRHGRRCGDHGRRGAGDARRHHRRAGAARRPRDGPPPRSRCARGSGPERVVADDHLAWDHPAAERWIGEGLAYCDGNDLDLWRLSILGMAVRAQLDRGLLTEATELAQTLLADERDSPGPRADALVVLTLVRARRGDPAPPSALAEAAAMVADVGWWIEVAIARAEVAFLDGRLAEVAAATDEGIALCEGRESLRPFGELALWRHRAGLPVPPARACRADRARAGGAQCRSGTRLGRARLQLPCRHGARAGRRCRPDRRRPRGAARARRRRRGEDRGAPARERGVKGVARGPRATTLSNPAQLTAREVAVLGHVAEGLSNAQVAERLFVRRAPSTTTCRRSSGSSARARAARPSRWRTTSR